MSEPKMPEERDYFDPELVEIRKAVDAEREACARLVESATDAHDLHEIARRIRARRDQS